MVSMEKPRFCQSQLIQGNTWRTDAVSHPPTQNNSTRPRLASKCQRTSQEAYTQAARVSPNLFLLVVELLVGSSAGIVQ